MKKDMSQGHQNALDLAAQVVETAKKLGAGDALASLRMSRGIETQVREGKVEKLQESQSAGLTVHLYVDGRYAAHTTSDLRKAELEAFLKDAIGLTRMLDADPERCLPDASLCLKKSAELPLFDAKYGSLDSDARKHLALAAEEAGRSDRRIVSATANFSDEDGTWALCASNGIHAAQRSTSYHLSAEVTATDGDKRPEDWWYVGGRSLADLGKPESVGRLAAERALTRIGARKYASGEQVLLVENRAAGRLLSHYLQALNGANLQQKRSFLDGQLGKPVMSPLVTLREEPHLAGGLGSRSFDREGMAAQAFAVIEGGVLRNFYLDWYYAKKLKDKPTTGTTSNLICTPGTASFDKLLAGVERGILVTAFNGGNSNSLTGDFSLGIQGRLIEKGALAAPVTEMNLTGNHKTFWNKLVALGADPYVFSSLRLPSLRFDGAAVAGS